MSDAVLNKSVERTDMVQGSVKRSVAGASFVVSALSGVSLVAGFLSQVVVAYLFGVGWEMDSYLAAIALPFAIMGVAIGGIGFVFIPILTGYKSDEAELQRLINKSFALIVLGASFISFLGCMFSGHLLTLTASNLPPRKLELAVTLARIIWIMVGFSILNQFLIAMNHFNKVFVFPAVTSLLPPLSVLIGSILMASVMGIKSIAAAFAVGTFLQFILLLPVMVRNRQFEIPLNLSHPGIRQAIFSVVPLLLSILPFTALPIIDVFWASRLPDGSISYVGYSNKIVVTLTAIIVQGVSVVLFPFFSEDATAGDVARLRERILKTTKVVLLIAIFPAVIGFVLRIPLLEIVFERGRFDRNAVIRIAAVLPFYLLGMAALAQVNITERVFFAVKDFKTIARVGFVMIIVYFLLCGWFIRHFSYMGIGIAFAIYWNLTFIVHSICIGYRIGNFWNTAMLFFTGKVLVSSILAGAIVAFFSVWVNGVFGLLAGTLINVLTGLVMFGLLGYFVFRIAEVRIVPALLMAALPGRESICK